MGTGRASRENRAPEEPAVDWLLLLADIFGCLSTIDNVRANISSAALMGICTVLVLMISVARVIERRA